MATMKDVAKLANCDVSTVSRALNNTSYVHPETKERIFEAVKELSYQPNVLAQGLRLGKRNTIGVIVPSIRLTVFAEITQSIEKHANQLGYSTIISNTFDDPKIEEETLNRMRNGFVDGIIIASTGQNNRILRDIQTSGIPIVQIIRNQEKTINSVVADYKQCGFKAVTYLHSIGCNNIGLINGPLHLAPYKKRYEGYQKAMQEIGLEEILPSKDFDEKAINTFEYGYESMKTLLSENPELDGVMTAVDIQGIGALRALKESNIMVPKKVKLISLTGHSIGKMLETTMTAMEIPATAIGLKALKIILEEIKSDEKVMPSAQHIIFSPVFTKRETT